MPEGPSQQYPTREDSVSLSDSVKEPSGDSDYRQPKHQQSADSDFSDDSTSARNRCAHSLRKPSLRKVQLHAETIPIAP